MKDNPGSNRLHTEAILHACMKYGVFLFVLLMMAGRLGTLREIGFYLPAGAWLLGALLKGRVGFNWREPLFISLCILSGSALLTSLSTTPFFEALHLFKEEYLKLLILYAVIAATFRTAKELKGLAWFMALCGALYLVSGLYKMSGYLMATGTIDYGETRNYATTFLFFIPFVAVQYVSCNGWKRFLWMTVLLGTVAGILLSGVRGSWLGLFVVFIIWMAALFKFRIRQAAGFLKRGLPAAVVLVVAVLVLFPSQFALLKERLVVKSPVSDRFEAWQHYFAISLERPLIGHGLDDDKMAAHYREAYKAATGAYPAAEKPLTPHDQYIKVLYQQGIIGLSLYIFLLGLLLYRTASVSLSLGRGELVLIGIAVLSAVTGEYIIRCLTEVRSLIPLGVLIGMAGAFLNAGADRREV